MLVFPLHDVKVHMLDLETIAGEESMSNAKVLELVAAVLAVQLQAVNIHMLEFEMFSGE